MLQGAHAALRAGHNQAPAKPGYKPGVLRHAAGCRAAMLLLALCS